VPPSSPDISPVTKSSQSQKLAAVSNETTLKNLSSKIIEFSVLFEFLKIG
jgi:hypothetical protein